MYKQNRPVQNLIFLTSLIALFALNACAKIEVLSDEMMLNGSSGSMGFANIVAVHTEKQTCTGALVASKMVITAAHCVFDRENLSEITAKEIEIGAVTNDTENEKIPVLRSIAHNEYKRQMGNYAKHDIAILILAREVSSDFLPMTNASSSEFIAKDLLSIAYDLKTQENSSKKTALLKIENAQDQRFAVVKKNESTTACVGQSGGPGLVKINRKWTLLGVASTSEESCDGNGWFVEIASHVNWIKNIASTSAMSLPAFVNASGEVDTPSIDPNVDPNQNQVNQNGGVNPANPADPNLNQQNQNQQNQNQQNQNQNPRNPRNPRNPDAQNQQNQNQNAGQRANNPRNPRQPAQRQPAQRNQRDPAQRRPNDADPCEELGFYEDQVCDDFCDQPDPDCSMENGKDGNEGDTCEELGYYSDEECDTFCDQPDPDCNGMEEAQEDDICEQLNYYDDGVCDDYCDQPDPDCDADRGEDGSDGDTCEDMGYYEDGQCDDFCDQPDPDCENMTSEDSCETLGYYGDGVCDDFCDMPDEDCEAEVDPTDPTDPMDPTDPTVDPYSNTDPNAVNDPATDECATSGFYGDGQCDDFCDQPDPDCNMSPEPVDECAVNGYYGDGTCDSFCPLYDTDCDAPQDPPQDPPPDPGSDGSSDGGGFWDDWGF